MKFFKFVNNLLPKWVQNNRGSISFDGIDDKIQNTVAGVITGYPFSIYCRVRIDSGSGSEMIFSQSTTTSNRKYITVTGEVGVGWQFGVRDDLVASPGQNGWASITAGTVDNEWHDIVCISKASNDHELYVDGILIGTSSVNATFPNISNRIQIGHWVRTASSSFGECSVSEVAIWSTDLTADQAKQLSSGVKGTVKGIASANLVAYYPLDDIPSGQSGDAVTFRDETGNGHDLTGNDGANNTGLTSLAEASMSYEGQAIIPSEITIIPLQEETDVLEITDNIEVTNTIIQEAEALLIDDSVEVTDTTVQETDNLQIIDSIDVSDTTIEQSDNLEISDSIIITTTNTDAKNISKIISINPLIFVTDTSPIEIIKVDTTDPQNITWIVQSISGISNAKDVSVSGDFIYIGGNTGQVVKVEIDDLNNQTIIDLNDSDDIITIETNSNFGITYAGTENTVGELYVIDERDIFKMDSDFQVIAPIEFQIESDFNIIDTFKMGSDFQVLAQQTFLVDSDFKCITKPVVAPPPTVNPLDVIEPIKLTDFQVFVNAVELEDTDLVLNSITITHSESEQSTASFRLSRKHDQLNTTLKGISSQITNQNTVEIKIQGITEFNGHISELDCKYNNEEFIQVNALASEKLNQANNITLSLPSLNSRLSLYDILIENPKIFNPFIDENDENPKKFKGIRIDLGKRTTQQVTSFIVTDIATIGGIFGADSAGSVAQSITDGSFIPIQNWTYFWGTIGARKIGDVKLGDTVGQSFFYIGTSLSPISEELWQLISANHHRQRIYSNEIVELGEF